MNEIIPVALIIKVEEDVEIFDNVPEVCTILPAKLFVLLILMFILKLILFFILHMLILME